MTWRIPYDVSNFSEVRQRRHLFVDHTRYIRAMEEAPDVLLFLRPRRFGKSLWISVLEHYYDLRFADRFEALFGGLDIGREPTPGRASYLVLRLDFSVIRALGSPVEVGASFLESVKLQCGRFLDGHGVFLPDPEGTRKAIDVTATPAAAFSALANAVATSGRPLYLLVDEYDSFTNELVATDQERTYEDLVRGSGVVRTFFKAVKEATGTGQLARCFLTGVNPLLLKHLTSGYKIAFDLSPRLAFAHLMEDWSASFSGTCWMARRPKTPSTRTFAPTSISSA